MTKLLYLFLILFAVSTLASAQPFAGQKFISGSLSFSKQESNTAGLEGGTDQFSFGISPQLGIMLTNRTALQMGFFFNKVERTQLSANNRSNQQVLDDYGINLGGRRFFTLAEGVGFFMQGGISYSWQRAESIANDGSNETSLSDIKGNAFSAGVQPGIYYFLSKRISLEASFGNLGFTHSELKREHSNSTEVQISKNNAFQFSGSTQLSFRVNYYWGKQE